jgi:hypothetical protein
MPRLAAGLLSLALFVGPFAVKAEPAGKGQARTLTHHLQQLEYLVSSMVHARSQPELDSARAALQGSLTLWAAQLGESHARSIYGELPRHVYDQARAERDAAADLVDALGRVPMVLWDPELRRRVASIRESVGPPWETRYYRDARARRDSIEELRRQQLRQTGVDILDGITPEQHLNRQLGFGDMGKLIQAAPRSPGGDVGK